MTHLCTIRSRVHEQDTSIGREGGFYELHVDVDLAAATASGDASGFVGHAIAEHLAGCIAHTGIPLGERMWKLEFTVLAQTLFHYPAGVIA